MRILVVKDETRLCEQLIGTLDDTGYAVDAADNGERGHFIGATEACDAVILDLGLPQLDGLSVLCRWRSEGVDVPVIILTARDAWHEKVAGMDAGADDYLTKPFRMEELPVKAGPTRKKIYRHIAGPDGEALLMLTRSVTLPSVPDAFQFEVTTNLASIEAAVQQFRLVLALGLGGLALGLLLAVILQVRLELRPLRGMRRGLADIRSSQAERLQGDYPTEIKPLVDDLNAVLADNDSLIERARTRAGNLAHALKTPLSILANEADAQSRQGNAQLGERLSRETQTMQAQIDWRLAHARIAARVRPGTRTNVAQVLERLRRTLARLYPERSITVAADSALAFRGEAQDLEQMLGNLMGNACQWATGSIRVRAVQQQARLALEVADDGPGLPPEPRELVAARGRRLDETKPGVGLGLAIVSELAELYGGHLKLAQAPAGGLLAALILPSA